jgi:CBS domain-containing protein
MTSAVSVQMIHEQINQAHSLDDLASAALRIDDLVLQQHGAGLPITDLMHGVSRLNAQLMARLWALLMPGEVQDHCCLLLMGSEGRGEQILKTDQDNALLLRDGFEHPDLQALAQRFSAALAQLGYPPCPGHIMITNPLWRQPVADFCDTLRSWVYGASDEGPMHLAIFFDALCVAGDPTLLQQARATLQPLLHGQDIYLARFAAAADQFHEPGNWFTRLTNPITHLLDEQPLDLKKLGIFPIVHGVRALALQHGVCELGTAERVAQLQRLGALGAAQAQELVQALHQLMLIRLNHQLQQRAQGHCASNDLRPSALSALDGERLQHTLTVVRRFRLFLRQHFQLDLL